MSLDTFPSKPVKTLTDLREETEDVPSNRSGNRNRPVSTRGQAAF